MAEAISNMNIKQQDPEINLIEQKINETLAKSIEYQGLNKLYNKEPFPTQLEEIESRERNQKGEKPDS